MGYLLLFEDFLVDYEKLVAPENETLDDAQKAAAEDYRTELIQSGEFVELPEDANEYLKLYPLDESDIESGAHEWTVEQLIAFLLRFPPRNFATIEYVTQLKLNKTKRQTGEEKNEKAVKQETPWEAVFKFEKIKASINGNYGKRLAKAMETSGLNMDFDPRELQSWQQGMQGPLICKKGSAPLVVYLKYIEDGKIKDYDRHYEDQDGNRLEWEQIDPYMSPRPKEMVKVRNLNVNAIKSINFAGRQIKIV